MAKERARSRARVWVWVLVVAGLAVVGWVAFVAAEIHRWEGVDQATEADAIAVFGAAQYGGRPSPVLHLRLDHAVELYRQHLAPVIITLGGGADRDGGRSEGSVGRDYLLAQGVPLADILSETQSTNTAQQVRLLAEMARERDVRRLIVVSDGTHMFRIRELCERVGLEVYVSPRAQVGHLGEWELVRRYGHEVLSYTALELGFEGGWLGGVLGED